MYKYTKGDSSNCDKLFILRSLKRTHGHDLRLEERRFNFSLRKGLFTIRAVKKVEVPPPGSGTSRECQQLKKTLDAFLQGYGTC